MSDFKNRKLLVNVQEFEKTGTRYQINGVDLEKAIFFWRKNQEMYDVIAKGDYKIVEEGGNIYLELINEEILATIERIQVCYEFASMSSTYDVDFNVDITTLKDRYNEAVNDIKAIFNYVEKNMFTADGLDVAVVLPQLNTGEVWIRTDDGYKGFNVGDIDANIEEFWKEFAIRTQAVFIAIKDAGDTQVDRINATVSPIDDKLQMIWRMYSVITGTQRYLSGGVLEQRDVNNIEKTLNGGTIVNRTGEPKRIYNGGSIVDRTIALEGFNIDLGEYNGGAK